MSEQADRELLELAAKAAGYEWSEGIAEYRAAQIPSLIALWIPMVSTAWNPLSDDGQALRLAVKLQLTIANEHVNAGAAYCTDGDDNNFPSIHSGANQGEVIQEDYAATRRAIVCAAAQIGKAIK